MPVLVPDFWNLAVQSRVLTPQQCQQFAASFAQMKGADQSGSATPLAQWLVAQQAISPYQAKVLLAGQPGPFIYGDYFVYDRIDSGPLRGMFRAVHTITRYPVCLYFLTGQAAQDLQAFSQLAQFCAFVSQLRSPYLLRAFHTVDAGRFKFVVLDDVAGEPLESRLAEGRMAPMLACALARHVALGLAKLHETGQTHGEIRPANVWLDPQGHAKLLYFPLWRDPWSGPTTPACAPDRLAAAADYMAPEIAAGQVPDPRSDVYGLGCLLYLLLAGRPVFDVAGVEQKLSRHRMELPRPLDQVNPSVPPPIAQVAGYMLAKDPARRYQNAGQVAQALQPYAEPALSQPLPDLATTVSQMYEAWLKQAQPRAAAPAAPKPAAAVAVPVAGVAPARPVAAAVAVAASPVAVAPAAVAAPTRNGIPAVVVPTTASSPGRRSPRGSRRQRQRMVFAGVMLLVVSGVVAIIVSASRRSFDTRKGNGEEGKGTQIATNNATPKSVSPPDIEKKSDTPKVESPPGREEAPINPLRSGDDTWASPTAGPPLDLSYMPSGVQAFIVLRPAEILAHPEGKLLIEPQALQNNAGTTSATGPLGPWAKAEVSRLCGGLPWDQLEQVVIGLLPNPPGEPRAAVVMRTKEPVELDKLTKAAGLEYRQPGAAKNIVVAAPGKTAAGGKEPAGKQDLSPIDDAMSHERDVVISRREMEALLRVSDNQRHFSMLFSPAFFYGDGRTVWSGLAERLKQPMYEFLEDPLQLQAGMLSFHLDKQAIFLELRLYGNAEKEGVRIASELDQKLKALPGIVDNIVFDRQWSLFSRKIVDRFPAMVRALCETATVGTCEKHAVARSYLPLRAASNLSFATYLALADGGGGGGGGTVAPAKKTTEPQSVAELLKTRKTTLDGQDEFQRHIKALEQEIGVEIEIMGRDLESEGITRNKNTKIAVRDLPVGDVLREMFKMVDPAGRLLYVIKKDAGGKEKIYITVRKKAEERKDPIPPEFAAAAKGKEVEKEKPKGKAKEKAAKEKAN
jgi:hypothetical protein